MRSLANKSLTVLASSLVFATATCFAFEDKPQREASAISVDLQTSANQKLDDDFHGYTGNNLKPFPRGRQKLAGVEFEIGEKFIQLAGKRAPDFPEKVEGIKVNRNFDKLYFLHATGWGSPGVADGTEIGHFTIHYDDETSATIPIEYGRDVRDWWALGDSDPVTRGEVAWKGVNEASKEFRGRRVEIRLFMSAWDNPQPGKKVTAFDYVSKNETMCSPFLIAVSAAPAADDRAAVEALKDAGAYLEFDETGRIKVVSLSGSGPRANVYRGSDDIVFYLAGLPTLEKAYLNSPGITDAGTEYLEGLTRLRWLSLNLSGVTDTGLGCVKNLKNLERLRLHGTAITDGGLLQLEQLRNLKVLDLSLTGVTDTGLPRLSRLSSLEELDLRNTNVTEAGISWLRGSLRKTKISR